MIQRLSKLRIVRYVNWVHRSCCGQRSEHLSTNAVFVDPKIRAWIDQFSETDRSDAALLASLIQFVPGDVFRRDLTEYLESRLHNGGTPIALYNESERRKWKGQPNRLFQEKYRSNHKRSGKKSHRAYGKVGPALIPRLRHVAEEIGSEGVVANILTQFQRSHKETVLLSPGPDIIREKQVRRFVLVTDFIGSGDRVTDYLDAAWRLRSFRSWWSRRSSKGLHVEVLAYAGTLDGVAKVERHGSAPLVTLVTRCPTINTVFPPSRSKVLTRLCEIYAPTGSRPLGYGGAGVLLTFDHGMPNNAPAIFWKSSKAWSALVPARSPSSVGSPFNTPLTDEKARIRIETSARASSTGQTLLPVNLETIVLSALRRSPRQPEAISGRLGLKIEDVRTVLAKLKTWGWINDNHQLTERGRIIASRLIRQDRKLPLSSSEKTLYFPASLRVPRNV